MKAVLSKETGGPETLVVEDIDAPTPAKGEVLVLLDADGRAVSPATAMLDATGFAVSAEAPRANSAALVNYWVSTPQEVLWLRQSCSPGP